MALSEFDRKYMELAMKFARDAFDAGDVPVGACLTIDGLFVGSNRNRQFEKRNWTDHAENGLVRKFASEINYARKRAQPVVLYTTLEPCLMCLGAAAHNRVTRIVYACPDPSAGSTHIKPPTEWYARKWPAIERGPYAEESCQLLLESMRKDPNYWDESLPIFENLALSLKKS